jgi:hypothetical protein
MTRNLIYGYIDPRSGELRYVGSSSNGMRRPLDFRGHRAHCLSWIKNLKSENLIPKIEIFEMFPDDLTRSKRDGVLEAFERYYIAIGRSFYPWVNLTNMCDGGEGCSGYEALPEERERRRQRMILRWKDPVSREKLLLSMKTEEVSRARSEGAKYERTSAVREKQSVVMKKALALHDVKERYRSAAKLREQKKRERAHDSL